MRQERRGIVRDREGEKESERDRETERTCEENKRQDASSRHCVLN